MFSTSNRMAVSCGMWLVAALSWPGAFADEAAPPLVTAATAGKYEGQIAAVELNVIEVKFARRRKLHLLSGSPNFRSEANLPVAIREVNLAAFEKVGGTDLSAAYLAKRIRATGKVVRDDGQWLLVVAAPAEIDVIDPAAAVEPRSSVVVIDEQGHESRVDVPLTAEIPRTTATLVHEGAEEVFQGVTLAELLSRAKILLGAESRGSQLRRYVMVTGQDGYVVLFSIAEIDPYFAAHPPLLADEVNGAPLTAPQGPLRLIVPGDKHRRRWVGQVAKIEVRSVLENPRPDASQQPAKSSP